MSSEVLQKPTDDVQFLPQHFFFVPSKLDLARGMYLRENNWIALHGFPIATFQYGIGWKTASAFEQYGEAVVQRLQPRIDFH